jgi:cytochrome c2
LTVWLLAAGALWLWHIPALYDAALAHPILHILEHVCLFGTALLFWWVLISGRRWGTAGTGAKMLFVFTAALQSGPLGMLMTLSPHPWYRHYEQTAPDWGLSALADQQLAGTIMSIPMMLIYLGALLALLAPRLREPERVRVPAILLLAGTGMLLGGCIPAAAGVDNTLVPGGDAARGALSIRAYGCDACHTIPGIASARSTVGPPLDDWADRHYIAGALPNTPENLILWIRFPQQVEPGTVMPDLGVTHADARDIGAYLYTLRRD